MEVDQKQQQVVTTPMDASTIAPAPPVPMCCTKVIKRYLDPIAKTTSQILRSIEDLFGLLLKLCVMNPVHYHRRSTLAQQMVVPSTNARTLAKNLNLLSYQSMKTSLDKGVPPKFR